MNISSEVDMKMKEKILKVAREQLLLGGYSKLNFARIADGLNISKSNVYHHFKNKETLALEVLNRYETDILGLYNGLKKEHEGDYFGFFNAIEGTFWDPSIYNLKGGRVVIIEIVSDVDLPEALAKKCRTLYGKIQKIIRSVIQEGVDSKQIKKKIDVGNEASRALVIMVGMFTSGHYYTSRTKAKKQNYGFLVDWANSLK